MRRSRVQFPPRALIKLVIMNSRQTRFAMHRRFDWVLIFLGSFIVLLMRSRASIQKFPADPGYDYLISAYQEGIFSWFDLEPYVHFVGHFLSWLVLFTPIEMQAFSLSIIVHLCWSLTALGTYVVLKHEGLPMIVSVFSSLSISLCPAAAESSLANVGNVKWQMLIFAIFLGASELITHFPRLTSIYFFLTGLTNPLSILILLPLSLSFYVRTKNQQKKFLAPMLILTFSCLIQILIVGSSGLSGGGRTKVLLPWPDMGLFWWFGLISPSAICLTVLLVNQIFQFHPTSSIIQRVIVMGPILAIFSYAYGGIADRYFVAPMTISWFAATLLVYDLASRLKSFYRIGLIVSAILLFSIPMVKWFSSSWFLTAGDYWSREVKRAKSECQSGREFAILTIGSESKLKLSCSYILQD